MDQGEIPAQRLRRAMLQNDGLDALYRQILQDAPAFGNPDFKRILGALCFLRDTLSLGSLVVLLGLGSATDARRILRGCKSLLHVPPTDVENITLHMSFHDFLTDRNRNYIFDPIDCWIDPVKQHLSLLHDCIQLIVAESRGDKSIKETDLNFAEPSTSYAWANWPRHLVDLQPSGRGTADLLKAQFGEQYQSLFLYFLDSLGDGTLQRRAITWPDLERLDDEVGVWIFFTLSHLC